MDNLIFYILGGLLVIYFIIAIHNKRQSKRRKTRSFMEGRRLRDRRDQKD